MPIINTIMTPQLKLFVFVAASLGLIWLSWPSLRSRRFHGFYRFFGWESLIAFVLINLNYWFDDPFSPFQLVSWLMLIVSLFMVIRGALVLHRAGKPSSERDDPSLIGIEKTTTLITTGAYRYIRHPIYSSALYGAGGVFFKHPSWIGLCLVVITIFFFTITAKIEEAENISFFGIAYQDYMKRTKMFIPLLF